MKGTLLVLVFTFTFLQGAWATDIYKSSRTQTDPQSKCTWCGTAFLCWGECNESEKEIGRAQTEADAEKLERNYPDSSVNLCDTSRQFGSSCFWLFSKALCCETPTTSNKTSN